MAERFDVTNLLEPQTLLRSLEVLQPVPHFLRDRYAPKSNDKVFNTNTVLVEIEESLLTFSNQLTVLFMIGKATGCMNSSQPRQRLEKS